MSETAKFLQDTLGYRPKDPSLFERALTHSSVGKDSYERLEFLGDRVLGLVIARWLCERFPNEPEGKLSRRFTVRVSVPGLGDATAEGSSKQEAETTAAAELLKKVQ